MNPFDLVLNRRPGTEDQHLITSDMNLSYYFTTNNTPITSSCPVIVNLETSGNYQDLVCVHIGNKSLFGRSPFLYDYSC